MRRGWIGLTGMLLMITFITIGSTSCSRNRPGGSLYTPPMTEKKEKVRILFAQWSVSSAQVVEQEIKKYNDANSDNIRVEILKIPRDRYSMVMNMLLSSGEGPDVFEVLYEWLNSYIYKNWVRDLSAFVDDTFLNDFPSWAVRRAKDPIYGSAFYSIPSNQSTYRLIYNKDLFKRAGLDPEKPPKTFRELSQYAKIISDAGKGDRKYGFALPMGEEWSGVVQPMEASGSYSGRYFYNFKEGKYDFTVYKPWLQAILAMKDEGAIFPGETTMKEDLAMVQFAEGNIGMMYCPSWNPSMFENQFPTKFDWGVAMPPVLDEGETGRGAAMVSTAGWMAINSKTQHLNEAAKVWKYLYSAPYLGELFRKGSMLPVTKGIIGSSAYKPVVRNFEQFIPGNRDALYPNTPLPMDEWQRVKAYTSILTGDQAMDKVLTEEGARLNSLFETQLKPEKFASMIT